MEFKKCFFCGMVAIGFLGVVLVGNAHADVKQFKTYKEVYPDSKPDCLFCHVDKKPKKDDGKHELNPYGQTAREKQSPPTTDIYRELGPQEEFDVTGVK